VEIVPLRLAEICRKRNGCNGWRRLRRSYAASASGRIRTRRELSQPVQAPASIELVTQPIRLGSNVQLQDLKCGYYDPGFMNRDARRPCKQACYYHVVETRGEGEFVTHRGLFGPRSRGHLAERDARWPEESVIRGTKVKDGPKPKKPVRKKAKTGTWQHRRSLLLWLTACRPGGTGCAFFPEPAFFGFGPSFTLVPRITLSSGQTGIRSGEVPREPRPNRPRWSQTRLRRGFQPRDSSSLLATGALASRFMNPGS